MDSNGGGNTLVNEGYGEGYELPCRSEHQPVPKSSKTKSALAAEEYIFFPRLSFFGRLLSPFSRVSDPDPDVFPGPGPDPSPDPNPTPFPPPDPDPGFPADPLPTPAPVFSK
jgi:hypothetical protein